MENASKAMLMAAGVLIGILILSLVVYLFVSFGSSSAQIHQQNEKKQMDKFNSQFTIYQGKECTIYNVITIANLATENNKYHEFSRRMALTAGNDDYISVKLDNQGFIERGTESSSEQIKKYYDLLIQNDLNNMSSKTVFDVQEKREITYQQALPEYECRVEISPTTQRVYLVEFKK